MTRFEPTTFGSMFPKFQLSIPLANNQVESNQIQHLKLNPVLFQVWNVALSAGTATDAFLPSNLATSNLPITAKADGLRRITDSLSMLVRVHS